MQYFDAERDTLLVEARDLGRLRAIGKRLDLSRIRNLALSGLDQLDSRESMWRLAPRLSKCPKLRRFYSVIGVPSSYYDSEYTKLRLVGIDSNLNDTVLIPNAAEAQHEMDEYFLLKQKTQASHEQHMMKDPQAWLNIQFEVVVLGRETENVEWFHEKITVAPSPRVSVPTTWYTLKPVMASDDAGILLVGHAAIQAQCARGGDLHDIYQGITELFDTESHVHREDKDTTIYTFIPQVMGNQY